MEQLKPYNIYSYRELCNSIGEEPVKGSNKRVAQEKRIESHYRLEKVNRKSSIEIRGDDIICIISQSLLGF